MNVPEWKDLTLKVAIASTLLPTYDNFYRAKGNYHAFNTCNFWTNRIMKEAQLKHTFWTPFPFTIMNLYKTTK